MKQWAFGQAACSVILDAYADVEVEQRWVIRRYFMSIGLSPIHRQSECGYGFRQLSGCRSISRHQACERLVGWQDDPFQGSGNNMILQDWNNPVSEPHRSQITKSASSGLTTSLEGNSMPAATVAWVPGSMRIKEPVRRLV